jgi:hypothetical protein
MSLIAISGGGNPQELRGAILEETTEVNFAAGATLNDVNIGTAVCLRLVGPSVGGAVTLNGVVSAKSDGRILKVIAGPGVTITVAANAAGSQAFNQFATAAAGAIAAGSGASFSWSLKTGQWVPTGGGGGGGLTSPLTTKGDIWGFAATDTRIPVGTNGQVPTADSTQADGVSYQFPSLIFGSPNFVAPPAAGTWTWSRNQDTAVVTSVGRSINIAYPPQGALAGANWPGNFGQPLASATFTLTACIAAQTGLSGTDPWAGIYWRDSVATKFQMLIIDMRTSPWGLSSYRFDESVNNVASTYFANVFPFNSHPFTGVPIWLRAQRVVGGNVTLSFSTDGIGFNACAAADATNFVPSPNELGITVVNDAGAGTGATNTNFTTLYSWNVGP